MKVFVDTAAVMEKPLAEQAGLGWQGKHTNLVSREFGSWLFLGAIFTTLELPPDRHDGDHCGSCRACLDACPTAAFPAPYRLDARRCISYLTIEHKGPIPRELRPLMGNRIYGCDDCLAVCPWNKYAQAGREAKLAARESLRAPRLSELARLDDASFRALFTKSPVKRTGRDRFIRNVLIAIGNSGDRRARGRRRAAARRCIAAGARRGGVGAGAARSRAALHACRARAIAKPIQRCARNGRAALDKRDRLMATLLCLGLGYCARYLRRRIRRALRSHRRHVAHAETGGPRRDAGVRCGSAIGRSAQRRDRGDASPAFGHTPAESGDPIAAALGERDRSRADARGDRLSLLARRLWRPRRRVGRRDRNDDPRACARRRAARMPSRRGRRWDASAAFRSRCCGLPASMAPDRTCSRGCSPGAPTASPSRDTCSTASTSSDIAQAIDAAFATQGGRRLQRHRRRARGLFRSGADGGEAARHRSAEGAVDGGGARDRSRRWR